MQVLKDAIRMRDVKPPLLPGESEDADETTQSVMLTVVVLRHFEAMLPSWYPLSAEPSPAAAKHQSEVIDRLLLCPPRSALTRGLAGSAKSVIHA